VTAPLWQPSRERALASNLSAFARAAEPEAGRPLPDDDYAALHRFSIEQPERFWRLLWRFAGVLGEGEDGPVLLDGQCMPGARWFPEARLNFAENLLRRRDAAPALIAWTEGRPRREIPFAELARDVSRLAQALAAWGVGPGDRVAGYLPNLPEAVVAMLAATSLGAIWSSCSPDFGTRGVVDRFGQITPRVLFAADGYGYAGKRFDSLARVAEIRREITSLERVVIVPSAEQEPDLAGIPGAGLWDDALAAFPARELRFRRFPFDHPLYVLYSSGTTGAPKCILHGAGGTLLQHRKEHLLHVDLKRDDRLFYFTTTGWMMWNWLVSGLASDATLVLYDGSPFHPDANVLFDLAQRERVAVFGTSAKFIDAAAKAGVEPRRTHDLSSLRTVLSTGSPLAPEGFDWVYASVKADVQLASISGGTDIIACFVGGNPLGPVHRGEIQAPCLGMRVEVFDEQGRSLRGEKGELVCTAPFPSIPIGFWNDPDGRRFRAAYFEKHPGVWSHGDFAEITPRGSVIIYGRSDAVLNPGGVRIGTAEIYRQVEAIPEVLESLAIGQEWQGDTRVVLFVRLREGVVLGADLDARIRRRIRNNTTPRHVPAKIVQVADIPRTKSGKIVELAVREVVHGRPVANREALANPEALALFEGLAELAR
jgi:acetoacetyl-CoA synthetase